MLPQVSHTTKEDISLQKRGHTSPRRHQLRRLFPVCITALSAVYCSTVAVFLYNCPEPTVQLYRQGKVPAIDDDMGGTYTVCFYKDLSSLSYCIVYRWSEEKKKKLGDILVSLYFSCVYTEQYCGEQSETVYCFAQNIVVKRILNF